MLLCESTLGIRDYRTISLIGVPVLEVNSSGD